MAGRKFGRRRIKAVTVSPGSFNDMLDLDIGAMERKQNEIIGAQGSKQDQISGAMNKQGGRAFKRKGR